MNNTEFMLGNLAQDQEGNLLRVVHLNANQKSNIGFEVVDRDKYPLKDGWQAEPIPINEEMLFKLGFKKDYSIFQRGGFYLMKNDYSSVKNVPNNEYYIVVYNMELKSLHVRYVHQLQNIHFVLLQEHLKLTEKEQ